MVKSNVIQYSLIGLVLGLVAVPNAQALGTEMFVCTGADGVRTYQNSDGGDGCVPLNLNPITVVPAPRSASKSGGISDPASTGGSGRRATAAYDNRSAADFNAKDDRMKILQEELRIEESKLKSLQDEYKNGQPDLVSNLEGVVLYANLSAETLLEVSRRSLDGQALAALFVEANAFREFLNKSHADPFGVKRQVFELIRPSGTSEHQQLKVDREARMMDQSLANKELIRNLAHEIKNPLGGIRGAAQLLEVELPSPELKEYTQVVIKESDRLQTLVDRLLAPHRKPHIVSMMNIHEVCERVRSVILAEHPKGLKFIRDYDISIPEFLGDLEQLIQAILNIALLK
eukprot:gene7176-7018_t